MRASAHFTPVLFEFLSDLSENNNREWFQANKDRYERDVRDRLVQFVADFDSRLTEISPHMVADPRPSGGSVFRIYRDVRFSKDKSPYKTNAAIHFRHEVGRKVHGPGFYLHLQPGSVFTGAGIWRPDYALAYGKAQAISMDVLLAILTADPDELPEQTVHLIGRHSLTVVYDGVID